MNRSQKEKTIFLLLKCDALNKILKIIKLTKILYCESKSIINSAEFEFLNVYYLQISELIFFFSKNV